MSNMLEQAIIDADALKEAALKNAETLVLEKYSNQIKNAVENLLEQDDPLAAAPIDAMPAMPEPPAGAEMDPMAGLDPAAPLGGEMDMMGGEAEKPSILDDIPLAATSKNDDQIEIPLDQLMEELAVLNETFRFGGDSHNDPELFEHNLAEIDEEGLEEILHEQGEEAEDEDEEVEDISDSAGGMTAPAEGDGASLEEDLIAKIAEQLTVDLSGPNKSGWAGTPQAIVELAEEEILALEQDSEVREQKAAMRKAVNTLDEVNETIVNQNTNLYGSLNEAKKYVGKLKDVVVILKEKLEDSNLTNAILLYQNKALTSDSLNERQKQKLVEAISNADSIEEARVIFDTLQSTVGSTSRKKQPKSLSEAVQKPSSMTLSARRERNGGQKKDPTLERWKFLAGIDK
jgi:hypothetical protein